MNIQSNDQRHDNLSQDYMAAMLESIGSGIISTDKEGKITFMNRLAEEITGWKAREIYDKDFKQVFSLVSTQTNEIINTPINLLGKNENNNEFKRFLD